MDDYVVLTRDNIPEVMEATGLNEQLLKNLLEEMERRGAYPVPIPPNDEAEWM